MTDTEVIEIKESIVGSIRYANSGEPLRFGDKVKASLLLDEGSVVVGYVTEVQLWFNGMGCEYLVVACVDDGDEFFYCDTDGMELVEGVVADG